MELVLEVFLNNSKVPAKPNTPIGKGLIKVSDIISVEKQDLKCVQTNLDYFIYRYPHTIPLLIEMMSCYLSQDFPTLIQKIAALKKTVENTKVEVTKTGPNHHTLKKPENMQKAMQMFDNELKTIALLLTFINENVTKLKKYTVKSIKIVYKNKEELMKIYENTINEMAGEGGISAKSEKDKKDNSSQQSIAHSALSNRGSFDSDI